MTAAPASGVFTQVDQAHVALLGAPAAILFARIAWRCERDGSWKASRSELAAETGLTPDTIRTALRVLREREWITGTRAAADDATMVWMPVLAGQDHVGNIPRASGEIPHLPDRGKSPISSTQTVETTTRPPAAPAAGPEEPAMTIPDSTQTSLFPAVVVASAEQGPPKTAQTLVARWCDGYRARNGHDAPKPLMGRVAGQMGRVAKTSETHGDWVAAYDAAYRCGEAGRWDPVAFMSRPAPARARTTNAFAAPELGGRSEIASAFNFTPLALGDS